MTNTGVKAERRSHKTKAYDADSASTVLTANTGVKAKRQSHETQAYDADSASTVLTTDTGVKAERPLLGKRPRGWTNHTSGRPCLQRQR